MVCLKSQYFSLNRILALALGLWPYKRSKLTLLQLILLYSILTSFILVQFTVFLTSECTSELVIEVLSGAFFFMFHVVKYNSHSFNKDAIKYLLELLQHTYDEISDEGEIAIMEKYGRAGKRYTKILAVMSACGLFVYPFLSFRPRIFDVASSMNKTQPRSSLYIATEYFVDPEKYFYYILLHAIAALYIGLTAVLVTATINIVYHQLVCRLFRIASYRMEQAMAIHLLEISNARNYNMIHKGLVCAVDIHRKAMIFEKIFLSKMKIFLFFLIAIGLGCTSLNLFRIFQIALSEYDFKKIALPVCSIYVLYMYTYFANALAQQITDHNDHVFATVYKTRWYLAPLQIQKLILFLLQRRIKPFYMNVGGVFVGSLENASKLMSASMSYFTVLYSTRQNT